jgi:hypothetical protein
MEAFNLGNQASFGAEIYHNTIQELTAATATTMLDIVFSTGSLTGQTFNLGEDSGYSCPDGYALNTCNTGTPYCVKITESNKVCVTTVRGSNPTIPLGLGCSVVIEPITMSASSSRFESSMMITGLPFLTSFKITFNFVCSIYKCQSF